jgi:N utilization substance protein B
VVSPRQKATRARSMARRQLMQALYQWQLSGQPWQDVYQQFAAAPEFGQADGEYFREALMQVADNAAALDADLAGHAEIPPARLDPVEHAILLLGLWELMHRPDVPYRVVINESVELAKRFGVLDRASMVHRAPERGAA